MSMPRTQRRAVVAAAQPGGPVSTPRPALASLSGLHLVVLACAYYEHADTAEDVARALGLELDEVEQVCAELAAAGYLAWLPPN